MLKAIFEIKDRKKKAKKKRSDRYEHREIERVRVKYKIEKK